MFENLKSRVALTVVLLMPVLTITPASAKAPGWDDLVKAAQAEGRVEVVLGGQVPLKLRAAMPAFEKKYGVKVSFHTGGGRKLAARMLAERSAGRYTYDVRIGGANTALKMLLPNGVLAPFPDLLVDPEVKNTARWYKNTHHYTDPERRYIFTWGASPSYNIVINTKMVKPDEIRSYQDLLDPKWKGKIVSWSPGKQGTAAGAVPMLLNPKIGEQWFRRWANETKVTIVDDARQGAEWVALGRFPIGMFGLGTQADSLRGQGFPIQGYLPHPMAEGEVLSASAANIMAIDRAPHPNAMKLFINWALSKEAQALFIKIDQRTDSLRTDVDNSIIEEQYRIDNEADYFVAFTNDDYINRQSELINKLRQIMKEAGYQ